LRPHADIKAASHPRRKLSIPSNSEGLRPTALSWVWNKARRFTLAGY
jgi:hypothetical protein